MITPRVSDNVFPLGDYPRSCLICGQHETGRGWRMGFAKASHGGMHVREGTARVIMANRDMYVLTAAGVEAAKITADSQRCERCGLTNPKHARTCLTGWMIRDAKKRARIFGDPIPTRR